MIKQPKGSKLCGHCCLATILDISLEEAVKLIGHENGTTTKELTKHFAHKKLKRGFPNCYSLCISRPIGKKGGGWHWVLYKDWLIYDPVSGRCTGDFLYTHYISSYIEIL